MASSLVASAFLSAAGAHSIHEISSPLKFSQLPLVSSCDVSSRALPVGSCCISRLSSPPPPYFSMAQKCSGRARSPSVAAGRDTPHGQNESEEAETAKETSAAAVGKPAVEYVDSLTDLLFIHMCRQAYGRVAGWQSPRSFWEGYQGMVEVSRALMRGRSSREQQAAVLQGFPSVPEWFRRLFPYSRKGAEINAAITPIFFQWLVGPSHVEEVEVEGGLLRSCVKIECCRYLHTSGCVGMCVNLCKAPTQHFFTSELGMPLMMEPNFRDMSCRMIFGQQPSPLHEDEAINQPCLSSCPSSSSSSYPCPQLQ